MTNTITTPRFEITVNPEIMDVKWGDVVFVDFTDNSRDSEQSGIRPAIIIQNDKGNEHSPNNRSFYYITGETVSAYSRHSEAVSERS